MNRLVLPLSLLVLSSAACHKSDEAEANADDYFYDCDDSMKPQGLTVFATDEAYRDFIDKVTAGGGFKKDDTQAPQLMSPAADATLSIAAPPMFSFSGGMTLRTKETRLNPRRAPTAPSRWAYFKDLFTLERKAWAHCPNVTGPLYLFQLTAAGATDPAYTALASVTSFTPSAEAWKAKMQPLSGKKVTLTLARGVFNTGHLELGPFVATKDTTFTVGP
jgi:hypothetical protein